MFSALGLYGTQEVWNMALLAFWDRMVRLPEHRIGHIAMKNAMQDMSNQFTKKVRATFKEIFDYVPGELTSPVQGKYAFKAAIKEMQWEKQQNAWRQHVQDHKNDDDTRSNSRVRRPEPFPQAHNPFMPQGACTL